MKPSIKTTTTTKKKPPTKITVREDDVGIEIIEEKEQQTTRPKAPEIGGKKVPVARKAEPAESQGSCKLFICAMSAKCGLLVGLATLAGYQGAAVFNLSTAKWVKHMLLSQAISLPLNQLLSGLIVDCQVTGKLSILLDDGWDAFHEAPEIENPCVSANQAINVLAQVVMLSIRAGGAPEWHDAWDCFTVNAVGYPIAFLGALAGLAVLTACVMGGVIACDDVRGNTADQKQLKFKAERPAIANPGGPPTPAPAPASGYRA